MRNGTALGAALGGGLFGLLGYYLDARERWAPVAQTPVRIRALGLPRGRLGVGAGLSFQGEG